MSGESEYRYCSTGHMMCYPMLKSYDINPLLPTVANSVNPFAFLCKHMVYLTLTCKPTNEGWSDSL